MWVYGPMDSWVRASDALRRVTTRLPHRLLYSLCAVAATLEPLWRTKRHGQWLDAHLPISRHPRWRWRLLDTFDWYAPPIQTRHTEAEVVGWFRDAGLGDVRALEFPVSVVGRKP